MHFRESHPVHSPPNISQPPKSLHSIAFSSLAQCQVSLGLVISELGCRETRRPRSKIFLLWELTRCIYFEKNDRPQILGVRFQEVAEFSVLYRPVWFALKTVFGRGLFFALTTVLRRAQQKGIVIVILPKQRDQNRVCGRVVFSTEDRPTTTRRLAPKVTRLMRTHRSAGKWVRWHHNWYAT